MNAFDVLKERGYIAQSSNEEAVKKVLSSEQVTLYCGYDPTADSLHIGHFITLMALSHLQKAGHRIITLVGGGTASIGDPTGKNDMRKMLTWEDLKQNAEGIKKQISKFISYENDRGVMVNNVDWLLGLEYLPFLREIAVHFSVNRMLTFECYKTRMEQGLSLLEFNYMVMQSYDFLQLYKNYHCTLQVGGDDQWSNMLYGIDLIRKKEQAEVNVLTFNLLLTSDGKKMGKTEKGALWLDANKTSPYEFYQYFRNIQDDDVYNCLCQLTFLPMDEVRRLSALPGEKMNDAKKVLAYEITKIIHGELEAKKAEETALALFSGSGSNENMPTKELSREELTAELNIILLLEKTGISPSRSETRRLIEQGGLLINSEKMTDLNQLIQLEDFKENELIVQKGKKTFIKVKLI